MIEDAAGLVAEMPVKVGSLVDKDFGVHVMLLFLFDEGRQSPFINVKDSILPRIEKLSIPICEVVERALTCSWRRPTTTLGHIRDYRHSLFDLLSHDLKIQFLETHSGTLPDVVPM